MSLSMIRILAPNGLTGWLWRLPVVAGCGVAIMSAAALVSAGMTPTLAAALHMTLIALPFAAALLWAFARVARLEQRLFKVQNCDPTTGLSNRGHFLQRLQRALPQSGVLLLLDIDNLKAFNTFRGHRAGDLCVMALAQRVRELTCGTDIIGRLDGAVFGIYLPGAPVETARAIGDRLSAGLKVVDRGQVLRVTVSVGAVVADGCTPLDTLLRDADRALDRAKLQGRARMIVEDLSEAA